MALPPSFKPVLDFLAGYPDWLVVAGLTVAAVVLLWILAKILKWSLYVLMALVLIAGAVATGLLLFDFLAPGTL